MKRNVFSSAVAVALMFVCSVASAQSPTDAGDPLSSSCNGAWREVRQAIDRAQTIDFTKTREGREKISCLLDTISRTTFSSRDSSLDVVLQRTAVRLLIDAVGPDGYDFFAAQIPSHSSRVRSALIGRLLSHGQPEAFEAYFSDLRRELSSQDARKRDPEVALNMFEPLVLHGRCIEELCSARINETLRIVGVNLDLVTQRLRQLEAESAPTSKSAERSRRLRAAIERIARNEAQIGSVPK